MRSGRVEREVDVVAQEHRPVGGASLEVREAIAAAFAAARISP